jgi:hypothetical protein
MKQHFDDECVVSVDLTALAKHQQQVMADVMSGRITPAEARRRNAEVRGVIR